MTDLKPKRRSTAGKRVAWNGISFSIPEPWEPAKIGKTYLLFESDAVPILEIKWNRIQGRFSAERQLRRLADRHQKKLSESLEEIPLPESWTRALKQRKDRSPEDEAVAFSWQGENIGGKGVLLYASASRTAALIQLYQKKTSDHHSVFADLLSSFQDHSADSLIPWILFDIQAQIPGSFQLTDYRFAPGEFRMNFTGKPKTSTLTLHRWGPASVLLRKGGLSRFAAERFQVPEEEMQSTRSGPYEAMEWIRKSKGWFSEIPFLRKEPHVAMGRIWHVQEKNRLLAVRMEGKGLDEGALEQVCKSFKIICIE